MDHPDRKALEGAIAEIEVLIQAERAESKKRIDALRERRRGLERVLGRYRRADEAAAAALTDTND